MDMQFIKELILEERTVLRVYDDATGEPVVPGYRLLGHPTIGTGRSLDTHGISAAEAGFLLDNDLAEIEGKLRQYSWWVALNPVRQFVIVSMAFNMGIAGLLAFPHMIAALFHADYPTAASEMLASRWAKQLPVRSLRLSEMMHSGCMPSRMVAPSLFETPGPSV
jgi:lysozyme